MKYIDRLREDEQTIEDRRAENKAKLAENSAEKDLIDLEGEIEDLRVEVEELKSSEDFDLRKVMEKCQELEILKKDLAKAQEIKDELF